MELETTLNPYFRDFAPWLTQAFYGQEIWVWLALPLAFLAAYLVCSVVIRIAGFLACHAMRARHKTFYDRYVAPLLAPVELWIGVLVFSAAIQLLPLDETWLKRIGYFTMAAATYAVVWALFRLITNGGEALRERFTARGKSSAAAIIPLMRRIVKGFVAILAFLALLQNWGFDVAALLAGLGIGGVAVALASQKTVENLFGGVSVTLDQPVRIGDFVNIGDHVGHVEDIGLRSTTIRTLQRTRITIPNAQFSEMKLENYTARDKMLLKTVVGLRYDTTPDQLRYIVMGINRLFAAHPKAESDGRARFVGFGDSSLNVELYAYIRTNDWNQYLVIREDIFLRIMDIVKEAGSDFAFPSTTVYLERSPGLDAGQKDRIAAEIGQLRERSSLAFPLVPEDEKHRIEDSLDFPPKGSAMCRMQAQTAPPPEAAQAKQKPKRRRRLI